MKASIENVRGLLADAQRLGLYVLRRPALLAVAFFAFLVARNWRVFAIMDIYDAYFVKLSAVEHGFSLVGIKQYVHQHVLVAYNQHFIPLWFIAFFMLVYPFDSNPYVLGVVSFGAAACLLVLLYAILTHFFGDTKKGLFYCLLSAVIFSGTPFFLEMMAWKWETGLLLSVAGFCFALLIVLKHKTGWLWQTAYVMSLFASFWTFGTTWTGAWGILVFLLLKERTLKNKRVILTAAAACIGTTIAILASHQTVQTNVPFLLSEFPAFVVLIAVNILLGLSGALRYIDADFIRLSSVLGITALTLFGYHYGRLYVRRKLTERDMLVVALVLVYCALILLGLFRLMPMHGFTPTSDPRNYLFGNRYLFIFSIPLYLALAVGLGDRVLRFGRSTLGILMVAALVLGVTVGLSYTRLDPVITNPHRTEFYDLTPSALQHAASRQAALPNVVGDLYFPGAPSPLQDAVHMRSSASQYKVRFVDSASLSPEQCRSLHDDRLLTHWLDLYSTDWCRNQQSLR